MTLFMWHFSKLDLNFKNKIKICILHFNYKMIEIFFFFFWIITGGDIGKWNKVKPNYFVGVDIAETSVEQAKTRFRERRNNFRADFFAADCTKTDLDPLFKEFCEEQDVTFDIVSCQFAFHYCFESVQQADCMLRNISKRLRKGGFFIGTTTDANDIGKIS